VPAQHGLYTAIVMTAVGAVFDSSRQLINGPTNAISIAVFSALAAATTPDERLAGAVLLGFLIGAFQVGITLLRLGDLTRYVSHSVVTGFTLGAGTLVVLEQVRHLLGLAAVGDAHDPFLWRFWRTITEGGPVHPATAMVGVGAIVAVLALRALKARLGWILLPEFFLVVAASAWVAAVMDLEGARRGPSFAAVVRVAFLRRRSGASPLGERVGDRHPGPARGGGDGQGDRREDQAAP
jgi:SulP family sulfate permease